MALPEYLAFLASVCCFCLSAANGSLNSATSASFSFTALDSACQGSGLAVQPMGNHY